MILLLVLYNTIVTHPQLLFSDSEIFLPAQPLCPYPHASASVSFHRATSIPSRPYLLGAAYMKLVVARGLGLELELIGYNMRDLIKP